MISRTTSGFGRRGRWHSSKEIAKPHLHTDQRLTWGPWSQVRAEISGGPRTWMGEKNYNLIFTNLWLKLASHSITNVGNTEIYGL